MADCKVILIGGQRSGKSTVLACTLNQMAKKTYPYMRISHNNSNSKTGSISLEQRLNYLKSFIARQRPGCAYLVDFHSDDSVNSYIIDGRIPDGKGGVYHGKVSIEFIDIPGCVLEHLSSGRTSLNHYFSTADIFIIVVDTPYLMDSSSNPGYFNQINKTSEILHLFQTEIRFNASNDLKKIIFVPVKCEKWENNIDVVTSKLQTNEYYGDLINYIKQDSRFSISIIPAFTVESLEFSEFGEPLITVQSHEMCSPTFPDYRFADGTIRELPSGDRAVVNMRHKISFPFYSWYKNRNIEYFTKNCDQLALHIWRFALYKKWIVRDNDYRYYFFPLLPSKTQLMMAIFNIVNGIRLSNGMRHPTLLKDHGDGIHNIVLNEKVPS